MALRTFLGALVRRGDQLGTNDECCCPPCPYSCIEPEDQILDEIDVSASWGGVDYPLTFNGPNLFLSGPITILTDEFGNIQDDGFYPWTGGIEVNVVPDITVPAGWIALAQLALQFDGFGNPLEYRSHEAFYQLRRGWCPQNDENCNPTGVWRMFATLLVSVLGSPQVQVPGWSGFQPLIPNFRILDLTFTPQ